MMFSPWWMLAGMASFMESLTWHGEQGNIVMVLPRAGGAAKFIDAPASYMWHALNAYEAGNEIIADFVGYDAPDHFVPKNAMFYEIMQGRMGRAINPGTLRGYRIDLVRGKCREEIADAGHHEFPMVDPRAALHRHTIGYMTYGEHSAFWRGIKRFDYASGRMTQFDFGERTVTGEPVFVAAPDGALNEGWLISQVLDGDSGKSYFAILDANNIEAGPLAKIWLPHHLPISFHGAWHAAA
jgi:all-trans-8'-apo-beta-carotenal 15,15'-oxygenase